MARPCSSIRPRSPALVADTTPSTDSAAWSKRAVKPSKTLLSTEAIVEPMRSSASLTGPESTVKQDEGVSPAGEANGLKDDPGEPVKPEPLLGISEPVAIIHLSLVSGSIDTHVILLPVILQYPRLL